MHLEKELIDVLNFLYLDQPALSRTLFLMGQFDDQFYYQFYPVLYCGASFQPRHVVAGARGRNCVLWISGRAGFLAAAQISVALEQDKSSGPRRPADHATE